MSLLRQSTTYLVGNILAALCGVISFPVWTRVLSKEDYGILSLVMVTVTLLAGGSKFGFQHASLRYYSHFQEQQRPRGMSTYYTTVLLSTLVVGGFICFVIPFGLNGMTGLFTSLHVSGIVLLIGILGLSNAVTSVLLNMLRAAQRAVLYSVVGTVKRYGAFLMALVFFFAFSLGTQGLFIGYVVNDVAVVLVLMAVFAKKYTFSVRLYSPAFFKDAIVYGLPLIAFELATVLLAVGDRYIIQHFMGEAAVGTYTAAYSVCTYSVELFSTPLRLSVIPLFFMVWERDGVHETKAFLDRVLRYYLMICIPVGVGLIVLREDILVVLASEKYREAADIIPYVAVPLILYGAFFIFGAGFLIKKKTAPLAVLTLGAFVLNVVLNVLLIPRLGLTGAAIATLVAYVFLSTVTFFFSRQFIAVHLPLVHVVKYTVLISAVVLPLSLLQGGGVSVLATKVLIGILVYSSGILLMEPDVRRRVASAIRLKASWQPTYRSESNSETE